LRTNIRKRPHVPSSIEELIAALKEEWAKIDINHVNTLCESMPGRLQAVYKG
jgi:hypothetical protein